ncbi:MAG: DUF2935 domain-containing protein [Clostridiales bacterium]|nr:DUF2935 domain-containing protein [Clostridiales bacterium]
MLSREDFIQVSLEMNLFFQRIMKEHLFFLETNITPAETALKEKAKVLKQGYEKLLAETAEHAGGAISDSALKSNSIVTPYTLRAEELTSRLTGAGINTQITKEELRLADNSNSNIEDLENRLSDINRRSYSFLAEVITFKKKLLSLVSECKIFIPLYPEMLEHITQEAEYYLEILKYLMDRRLLIKPLCNELNFWNNIMAEHAQFIDGMLDPTEKRLKETAEKTAKRFEGLVDECIKAAERLIIQKSTDATQGIIDYKKAATEGLLKCSIKSVIPPLLADHVYREANHYLRLLNTLNT